jgi:hypothetical protein
VRYPDTPILQSPAFLHEFLFLGLASELCAAIDAELVIDIVEMRAAPADESNQREIAIGKHLAGIALKRLV